MRTFMNSKFPGSCGYAAAKDERGQFILVRRHKTCERDIPRGAPIVFIAESRAAVCAECWNARHPDDKWASSVKRVVPPTASPKPAVPSKAATPCDCERRAMDAEVAHELLVAKVYGTCAQKHGSLDGAVCTSCAHAWVLTLGSTRAAAMQIRWTCVKERHPLGWMTTYREADAAPPMSAEMALEVEKLRETASERLKKEQQAKDRAAKKLAKLQKEIEAKSTSTVSPTPPATPVTEVPAEITEIMA